MDVAAEKLFVDSSHTFNLEAQKINANNTNEPAPEAGGGGCTCSQRDSRRDCVKHGERKLVRVTSESEEIVR